MKKILLVEDSPTQAMRTRQQLEEFGFAHIIQAENGAEALTKSRQERPDVIITDVLMPIMDGFQLCQEIRKDPDLGGIPIILQTNSYQDKENQDFGLNTGADAYLPKSASSETLIAVVNKVTSQKRSGDKKIGLDHDEFDFIHQQRILFNLVEKTTSLEHANLALGESEERFRQVTEVSGEWIWETDANNLFTYSSPIVERILGYRPDEIVGKMHFTDFFAPQAGENSKGEAKKILSSRGSFKSFIHQDQKKDGQVVTLETNAIPIYDPSGKFIGFRGVNIDITKRKKAEDQNRLAIKVLESLNHSQDKMDSIKNILLEIKKQAGIEAVAIRLKEGDDFPYYKTNGFPEFFVEAERHLCARDGAGQFILDKQGNPILECMCGNVICGRTNVKFPFFTKRGSFWSNCTTELLATTTEEDRQAHTRNRCNGEGYESVALIPLRSEEEIIGLLQLNDHRKNCFTLEMIQFFEGLGASIGISLKHNKAEAAIQNLSRFPSENPNPVMRFDQDEKLLYVNHAGINQLPEWHLQTGQAAPPILSEAITRSMNAKEIQNIDLEHGKQVFSFAITPIVSAGYTNVYGRDITDRKKDEQEIKKRVKQLTSARQIGGTLVETLELSQIYERLYEAASDLLPDSETMFISLYEPAQKQFRCVFAMSEGERFDVSKLPPAPLEPAGVGTQSEMVHTRLPLIVNNLAERLKKVSRVVNIGEGNQKPLSGLYVPMLAKDEVIGVVTAQSRKPGRYSQDDADMLSMVANTAAIAIQNARLYEAVQRRVNRMQALSLIDKAINASLDMSVSLEIVIMQTHEQLKADAVDILLVDSATNALVFAKAKGFKSDKIRKTNLQLGRGLPGKAVLERIAVVIPDLHSTDESFFQNYLLDEEGFVSYYCVPLVTKGLVKGVMEVYFRQPYQADPEWLDFLGMLGQQSAIAIDNAELMNSLQKTNIELLNAYDATLKGWVDALDIRDKETEGHTQRVTELSMALARRVDIEEKDMIHFERGALLHDIGKVAISDVILRKPGPLTDEEWVIMHTHPMIAHELLSKSKYLLPALDIPYCHHEKWDGSGYPRGLKGEEIPLAARIFAIVDVWDALTSDRPYRKAWSHEKALDHIQRQSGTHFDPQVVEAFLKLEEEGSR